MSDKLPAIAVGLALSILVLFAFWLYLKSLLKENEPINFGTWFILAYGDGLDWFSYFTMTGRWWLNFVPLAFAAGSIAIFLFALFRGRFGKLRGVDVFCIVTDVCITGLWAYFSQTGATLTLSVGPWLRDFEPATAANLGYQLSAIVAFVPMWWSQVKGRELEHPTPWFLWAIAFAGFTVTMALEKEKWEELIYPGVNLFTHYMIGVSALVVLSRLRLATALR